jgi:predicted DNA-binding antitoxin AbrB/MazE fold protein
MTITAEAVFQNGQLRLTKPVQLPEGTAVRLTITPLNDEADDPFEAVIGTCEGPADGAGNHDKYLYGDQRS